MPPLPVTPAPIIHLGPSLPRREAETLLPGGDFRPPVRRGDLYRERAQGGSVFVIIDGVFYQEHAISPRELIDVLRDGAWVVGASSMGALRAAECWPAGMVGVGAIYRLFRRGRLTSDDEVAVVFDPDGERPASLALVNVRHAVARALRRGHLTRPKAEALVRAAEETFYAERTWRTLLTRAGLGREKRLEQLLAGWDLKGDDARRVLRYVARQLAAHPALAHRPRRGDTDFATSEYTRERSHDALAGLDPSEARRTLARWHLVSGRYTRHALAIASTSPEVGLLERIQKKDPAARLLSVSLLQQEPGAPMRFVPSEAEQQGLTSLLSLRLAQRELWAVFMAHETLFADWLWQQLHLSGELDAELFRWRAIHEAASRARALGLAARPRDRYLAREEMAHAHGFDTWGRMERSAWMKPWWSFFLDYAETRALSRRMRDAL
ncbi:TfuA-like protein [Vitiosangium sp. GDMCC 1.1324]|uniref:TfuA-like protein n=1 Tax=Vitiosangium sp. (strain GDMCC 1.1324) TaxID=2138576 RepID=UPI000D33292C|nr:TfuA-like protein [Vitiosangium sp. GDMCC 1.1324]PTL78104.1 hypothetical protein DAT35_41560 [Vitiosangium sp. GDMCC 1.1324]